MSVYLCEIVLFGMVFPFELYYIFEFCIIGVRACVYVCVLCMCPIISDPHSRRRRRRAGRERRSPSSRRPSSSSCCRRRPAQSPAAPTPADAPSAPLCVGVRVGCN